VRPRQVQTPAWDHTDSQVTSLWPQGREPGGTQWGPVPNSRQEQMSPGTAEVPIVSLEPPGNLEQQRGPARSSGSHSKWKLLASPCPARVAPTFWPQLCSHPTPNPPPPPSAVSLEGNSRLVRFPQAHGCHVWPGQWEAGGQRGRVASRGCSQGLDAIPAAPHLLQAV
jgi:hypothetical protein